MTGPEGQYEGFFLLDPELSDERLTTVQQQIAEQITKLGGTVERQQPWGKRRLAYQVRRRRDGFYHLVLFRLAPAAVPALDQWCRLQEGILRRLIVTALDGPAQMMEAVTNHGHAQ